MLIPKKNIMRENFCVMNLLIIRATLTRTQCCYTVYQRDFCQIIQDSLYNPILSTI